MLPITHLSWSLSWNESSRPITSCDNRWFLTSCLELFDSEETETTELHIRKMGC